MPQEIHDTGHGSRNTGGDLELATRTKAVKAVISVDWDGNTAIKGLIVNAIRHDETLF